MLRGQMKLNKSGLNVSVSFLEMFIFLTIVADSHLSILVFKRIRSSQW